MPTNRTHYPFTAIVGQERMRLALLLNAIHPAIGGVLIRGEKGTAKSTMARALADLLPEQPVVVGCRYGCAPPELCAEHRLAAERGEAIPLETRPVRVIDLPNNATEDRVAGTLDLGAALKQGEKRFEPGLLAEAHRGILYVDEVNLLSDHLVDLLLDAAAMGVNTVEREGVSFSHPARFALIGTMNPEEGDLRPQLLDRFGLCVDVEAIRDIDGRVEVMARRAAFERDAAAFNDGYTAGQSALRAQVVEAQALLPEVETDLAILRLIAGISLEMGVDGHRADLVMLRTAMALAAFEGRVTVNREDVRRAAELALPHRMRRRPFEQQQFSDEQLQEAMDRQSPPPPAADAPEDGIDPSDDDSPPDGPGGEPPSPQHSDPGAPLVLPSLEMDRDRLARASSGRRQASLAGDRRGRMVRSGVPSGPTADVAVSATVRAAAAHPASAGTAMAVDVRPEDIREKVRETKVGAEILFVVDASGSMGAKRRMEAAKGAALTLLSEAYQRRDRVALVAFRGQAADVILPLTNSVELAHERLRELPTGGRTPLGAGLVKTQEMVRQIRQKQPSAVVVVVLITDGKANVALNSDSPLEESLALAGQLRQPGVHSLVLDADNDFLDFGLASRLADAAGAQYVRLSEMSAEVVVNSVRGVV